MRAREEFTGTAKPGLHFVGDEDDAVPAADIGECGQKSSGRDNEAAFAEHWLDDNGGDGFSGNNATKGVVEELLHVLVAH